MHGWHLASCLNGRVVKGQPRKRSAGGLSKIANRRLRGLEPGVVSCDTWGGNNVEMSINDQQMYHVTPDTVLPDEPGHIG